MPCVRRLSVADVGARRGPKMDDGFITLLAEADRAGAGPDQWFGEGGDRPQASAWATPLSACTRAFILYGLAAVEGPTALHPGLHPCI